ncbi:EutN/CcmL family microcompartment protein [Bacillus songklensis]|uniref:EutN/CcmL family microcompartment protein n=1 Tax=Bacillus songklensis TaxID=1069116 RepID=A0ABV8B727_9BACI
MILGEVLGSIWATQKEEGMEHLKLLIVQPTDWNGKRLSHPIVAADRIGAGKGERVLISRGSPAKMILNKQSPVDAVIVAIVDSFEVNEG